MHTFLGVSVFTIHCLSTIIHCKKSHEWCLFVVLVYPPDRVWRWAGKPCPNRRKRGGRKVFYKSIYRGNEHISVSLRACIKSYNAQLWIESHIWKFFWLRLVSVLYFYQVRRRILIYRMLVKSLKCGRGLMAIKLFESSGFIIPRKR